MKITDALLILSHEWVNKLLIQLLIGPLFVSYYRDNSYPLLKVLLLDFEKKTFLTKDGDKHALIVFLY